MLTTKRRAVSLKNREVTITIIQKPRIYDKNWEIF